MGALIMVTMAMAAMPMRISTTVQPDRARKDTLCETHFILISPFNGDPLPNATRAWSCPYDLFVNFRAFNLV